MTRKQKTYVRTLSGGDVSEPAGKGGPSVRRSNRVAKNHTQINEQGKDKATEFVLETGMPLALRKQDSRNSPTLEADHLQAQVAIEGLVEMDYSLQTDTERQKLRLGENPIAIKVNAPEQARDSPKGSDEDWRESDSETAKGDEGLDDGDDASSNLAAARPPPVNSSYLPLPWEGRLGYVGSFQLMFKEAFPALSPTAHLAPELLTADSRTCRLASIISHRHALSDPSKPEHSMTNRPDSSTKPDVALGEKFVQGLCLANIRDIVKMVRWNDKYGIKFMRLSSDMCPFASHAVHGYELRPFASGALAEAGKVIAKLGHRVTTHPGQYTQLGSPREEVVAASIRDLKYHHEMLSLLELPSQQNRDAVMVLHMGGTFGDKAATLNRFRHNYTARLSPSVKARLVLENDDVSWSVHDLLPICEELSIPLVLDYHHHNIVFDSGSVREGTLDISEAALAGRIAATWTRKGITQKMHYSEARAGAVTPRDRRKHSNRVATLPPCPPGMDLMIEAKDKEQAVFELMRTFKLPGFEKINDMVPHEREDENKPPKKVPKKRKRKGGGEAVDGGRDEGDGDGEQDTQSRTGVVSPEEVAMGGPLNRVYWPVGMEDWVRPKKRQRQSKKTE